MQQHNLQSFESRRAQTWSSVQQHSLVQQHVELGAAAQLGGAVKTWKVWLLRSLEKFDLEEAK